eukprot:c52334_g1_i1.p1 GENE.c52334_g1_i1~~c52334_g1_i1.p1  ORF type:complete len:260 (-),score=57.40 c52334_g1_i1:68-811(-)
MAEHDHGEVEKKSQEAVEEYLRSRLDNTSLTLDNIIEGNARWVDKVNRTEPEFFHQIGQGQHPHYLYIGCSDARVDATIMMGLHYGELFIHRNVGNVVSATDMNMLTCLDYAVNRLKVPHIVVCGHYDCGAAKGAYDHHDQGPGMIENWLVNLRDVHRLHLRELDTIHDPVARHRRFVELHVQEQCLNVLKTGVVQRARHASGKDTNGEVMLPEVHGLVFDPATGLLKKLKIRWEGRHEFAEVYAAE